MKCKKNGHLLVQRHTADTSVYVYVGKQICVQMCQYEGPEYQIFFTRFRNINE